MRRRRGWRDSSPDPASISSSEEGAMANKVTRREFIRDGVAAFTLSFAAPAFLVDIARAQGAVSRNLVVIYLAGGNDSLSTVIPYTDPFYFSRRPGIAEIGRASWRERVEIS